MEFQVTSHSYAAKLYDSKVIWVAVVISLLAHYLTLVWWPVSRLTAERVMTAVNELNIELVNLIPQPEPVEAPAPLPADIPIPQSTQSSDLSRADNAEPAIEAVAEENTQPLRIDPLAIQEIISAMDLSASAGLERDVPANELQLRGGSASPSTEGESYWSPQGNQVIVLEGGGCMVVPMLADRITHGKQVSFLSGAGCPYTPSLSEEMAESIMERVCAKFECD